MKRSIRHTAAPEFNMLALLDIIFIIVIFCIIGMTRMVFLETVDVENPELRVTEKAKTNDFVTITIAKDGKLFLNKEPVYSKAELSKKLADKKKSRDNIAVIINGDTNALLGEALHVLQTVREADLEKVYFKAASASKG